MKPDHDTKDWIKNASDEYAVAQGCRFDLERAQHVIDFFTNCLCLYEGVQRDEHGNLPAFVPLPWAESALRRCFGWVTFSQQHQREIRRFKKSFWWVPKKNGVLSPQFRLGGQGQGKTPIGAGVGLYMWYGLGEEGQHVGFCARDGRQAERMQRHSRIMAEKSPFFEPMFDAGDITYNKTSKVLTHNDTNSTAELITGDNAESQDGFNGSIMLDECHVVPDKLGMIINKSGLSRPEALVFGISTAGNQDSVFGRKMYEYGRDVANGKIKDTTFLHIAYEAPQNATDEDCKNPEVWRMANPALGLVLDEKEFASDCLQSQRSEADWVDLKQRRLGIWPMSASGFINSADWYTAEEEYDENTLQGQPCWIGMDLSRSLDMTAICLCFRSDDEKPVFRFIPYIWATERFLTKNADKADFKSWIRDGHLLEIPGKTIDQDYIYEECERITSTFEVQTAYYDVKYATELAKRLENDFQWEMVPQSQTMAYMTGPTKLFIEELAKGTLKHNGNPCFTWHAGNATAKIRGEDVQIVKPQLGEWKKIDAVVAAVMALNGAHNAEGVASFYDDNEMESF